MTLSIRPEVRYKVSLYVHAAVWAEGKGFTRKDLEQPDGDIAHVAIEDLTQDALDQFTTVLGNWIRQHQQRLGKRGKA